MSQGNRALLSAGCGSCAGLPMTSELTTLVLNDSSLEPSAKEVLSGLVDQYKGTPDCTIEDYMSELVDLLAIADPRQDLKAENNSVEW